MPKKKMKFSSATILNKYDPIEVEIDGETFSVAKRLPLTMLDGKSKEAFEQGGVEVLIGHMAEIFDVEPQKIIDLDLDIRVFRHILEQVQEEVSEQIRSGAKNPTEAGA